ncbi:MAG: efflux RND transporter periplasmic adaptor subunit [candidate division Zixibacteria bacterium]|nr:efflux RND transporter periplasmic adaptor subunit [candidate division Zixibacteria bacterium]
MKKVIFWLVLIVIVGFLGYRGWMAYQRSQVEEIEAEEEIRPVKIQVVKTSPLTEALNLTGDIKGIEEIDVYPKASGKLVDVTVKEGQRVKTDQVLAIVDRDIDGVKFQPAEITAPVAGIVGRVYEDKGARVSPPEPGPGMGTPILRIVNMDRVKVVVHVIERDFAKIKLNQKADISVDAYPDETFSGKVTLISPTINPMTRTASVEITIPNKGHRLKPGMFADADIIIREKDDAVLIPVYAVLEQSEISKVFTVVNGKAKSGPIQLGASQGELVEIRSGLKPGDTLIVVGQHRLSSGEPVRILEGGGE